LVYQIWARSIQPFQSYSRNRICTKNKMAAKMVAMFENIFHILAFKVCLLVCFAFGTRVLAHPRYSRCAFLYSVLVKKNRFYSFYTGKKNRDTTTTLRRRPTYQRPTYHLPTTYLPRRHAYSLKQAPTAVFPYNNTVLWKYSRVY